MEVILPIHVRYVTDDPVPISDIIESLQGAQTVFGEAARLLPIMVRGLHVEDVDVRVKELAQASPLRELIVLSIFLAFQNDLEGEVPNAIAELTGYHVPERFETIITVLVLIVVFYGAGAIKDFVVGTAKDGPSDRRLSGLISEIAPDLGLSEEEVRSRLDERYGKPALRKRLANATGRFVRPSKRQGDSPMEVNDRPITKAEMADVPADYIVEDALDEPLSRRFDAVVLSIHAKDRDHSGCGWAVTAQEVTDRRLRLKLMEEVDAEDLWRRDRIIGDIVVHYERLGVESIPRSVDLLRVIS